MQFDPDDPRLTAYALGELDEAERAEIEKLLEESPEARKALEDTQATIRVLANELRAESAPLLALGQREQVLNRSEKPPRPAGKWFSRPRVWALAASVLIMVGIGSALIVPDIMEARTRARAARAKSEIRSLSVNLETRYIDHSQYPEDPAQVSRMLQSVRASRDRHIGYDASDGTTSRGDVTVGPGGSSEVLKHGQFGTETPSVVPPYVGDVPLLGYLFRPSGPDSDQGGYVSVHYGDPSEGIDNDADGFGISALGSAGNVVIVNGLQYTYEYKGEDLTVPVQYTTKIPYDPFNPIDNDGNGVVDEIIDANGNAFTLQPVPQSGQPGGTEAYQRIYENPFLRVTDNPLSTFSIDVDTAAYANTRRFLNEGRLPPPDAVRIEELINYFDYGYESPMGEHPFTAHVEVAGCPWNLDHRLVRIGLKGKEIPQESRPPGNLVFLLDVSGSMNEPNKLPLVKQSMRKLVEHLTGSDRVAVVVYAGASGLVLPSTSCDDRQTILDALERLQAGGSTHGSAGIQLAYDTAAQNFIEGGVNRVILCTDGDFNVGITDQGQLIRLIEEKAKSGVFLSVLGFGTGNLKDSTMEQLADKGNGNYAYIDGLREGEKVLVEQMGGTLVTIAKDVKIQIEFNPAQVAAYRLIGYENRMLRKEDFNDDTKDAGEIGAGHTVTALYELIPSDRPTDVGIPDVDPLKYQQRGGLRKAAGSLEMLTLKLRYKEPDGDTSKLIEQPVTDSFAEYSQASEDFKFAASVAAFGMILRGSAHKGNATLEMVLELAAEGKGTDAKGYRAEFLELVAKAAELTG